MPAADIRIEQGTAGSAPKGVADALVNNDANVRSRPRSGLRCRYSLSLGTFPLLVNDGVQYRKHFINFHVKLVEASSGAHAFRFLSATKPRTAALLAPLLSMVIVSGTPCASMARSKKARAAA